jgi:hypothetical protein
MLKRILFSFVLGIVLAAVTSELAYRLQQRENRPPQRVELIIPAGTAERVQRGEASPSLPQNMTFVLGDTLVVVNQDSVAHQLGPLWVPAGTSASLPLESSENYVMECSFQPSRYLGLEVREPVTWRTRLSAIFFGGIPLGTLLAIYSVVLGAERKKKESQL